MVQMKGAEKADEGDCVGFIQLVFFDDQSGEVVPLGGAGFVTAGESDAAWANIPAFVGESSFMADRQDGSRDIVDDRAVSAETCEILMGKPIAELIEQGRRALAASLAEAHGQAGQHTGIGQ